MAKRARTGRLTVVLLIAAATCAVILTQAPAVGAGALLHPARSATGHPTPAGCEEREFPGDGITLRGWQCRGRADRRGTVVYLHGIADNRGSSRGVIERFMPKGFDVVAYDSRRHGESGGEVCTYGVVEKRDLRSVLDVLPPGPVVLIGTSLGAAVALQAAASDGRIATVIAAEVFSDLRTIATERAPSVLPDFIVRRAFEVAEQRGGFSIDAAAPLQAARSIHVPVLLIHGERDVETPPSHSQRVLEALQGPKRLILVPAAGHNHSLNSPGVWEQIDRWIDGALTRRGDS